MVIERSDTFLLLETFRSGSISYRLICNDPTLSSFFDAWCLDLSKRKSWRTAKAYAEAVSWFLKYVYEYSAIERCFDYQTLHKAIGSYENFLVYGSSSSDSINRSIAKVLGDRKLSGATVLKNVAAINSFLEASEGFKTAASQLSELHYIGVQPQQVLSLLPSYKKEAARGIKLAIRENSWFASCIAGGVGRVRSARLASTSKPSTIAHTNIHGGDDSVFPLDLCVDLINSTDCLRDKTLWSLMAASGCRISEALTVFWRDLSINPGSSQNNRVYIVDPSTRVEELRQYLTDREISKLSHKGRSTVETFLIEPFATYFWVNLDLYAREQRDLEAVRHRPVFHPFVFRNLIDGSAIPNSYQSVYERFKLAARTVTGRSYGFHSLRHMYAFYLHNYCPNPLKPNTFGFDLGFVQKMLGHASSHSVQRYARRDVHMLQAALSAMNYLRLQSDSFSSLQVQIEYLENQILLLKQRAG